MLKSAIIMAVLFLSSGAFAEKLTADQCKSIQMSAVSQATILTEAGQVNPASEVLLEAMETLMMDGVLGNEANKDIHQSCISAHAGLAKTLHYLPGGIRDYYLENEGREIGF